MIDSAFGNWFAGFTDGEGCFVIDRTTGGRKSDSFCYGCRFRISLREDDRGILEKIQEELGGIGFISKRAPTKKNQNPWVAYVIHKKSDCQVVQATFQVYPLRAKKARDFEIWSEALDCWMTHRRGDSWENMILLKKNLEEGRKYR